MPMTCPIYCLKNCIDRPVVYSYQGCGRMWEVGLKHWWEIGLKNRWDVARTGKNYDLNFFYLIKINFWNPLNSFIQLTLGTCFNRGS